MNTAGFVCITEFKSKGATVSVFRVRFTDARSAVCFTVSDLELRHPRCVCNNEVKYNESQNTTKFIS